MKLIDSLNYEPSELSFGTSGLRGLITDMTDLECFVNVAGFLRFLQQEDDLLSGENIYIAGDLRDSTPRIMQVVFEACEQYGLKPINCGMIPTPAVAYYAIQNNGPSIMVTGSHIPSDRNGIKFYKRSGEILKDDEALIKELVAGVRKEQYGQEAIDSAFDPQGTLISSRELPKVTKEAELLYISRYLDFFDSVSLAGKKIVVYQQSAVGRDMLVEILAKLGAEAIPVERSDTFIAIDTENVTDENKMKFKQLATDFPGSFAVISTDGDSDRPFVIDETGVFYRGDVLGCITADFLGAKFAAVPISSNDAVDKFCVEHSIELAHTKIGSPYVIAAMNETTVSTGPVASWEVNGGFLLGSDAVINGRRLSSLPTRDAVLPILCALITASRRNEKISELFDELPVRFTGGGLIDDIPLDKIKDFKEACKQRTKIIGALEEVFSTSNLGSIQDIDLTDGLRAIFVSGDVIHLRPSGNAPQFRVYTNASTQTQADQLVQNAVSTDGYIHTLLSRI